MIEWKNVRWVDGTEGPWGSKEFQAHLRGDLVETGGLFNLEKVMVWVLRKELEYKVEKWRLEVMHPRIRTKSELPELVNEPFCLSPHEVLRSRLIVQSIIY